MATLTTGTPVTIKEAFLRGEILAADQFKMGLFRMNASLGRSYGPTSGVKYTDITASTSDELSGTGYTTGGVVLATYASGPNNATPTVITGTGAWLDWSTDPSWTGATITTAGCFAYDNTHANKLIIGIADFGGDKTITGGTFTLTLPTPAAGTAIFCFN